MRLMSTSLIVLALSSSLIILKDCLEVGVVVRIVNEVVAVVEFCVAEAPSRRLYGDAASRDTS